MSEHPVETMAREPRTDCWFFHRWTKWKVIPVTRVVETIHGNVEGSVAMQERYCARCGRTERTTVNVGWRD